MAKGVLVAGATGSLGRLVVVELVARGVVVRCLCRRPEAARRLLPSAAEVAPWTPGEAVAPGAWHGMDCLFSALGNSVQPSPTGDRRSFFEVDTRLNLQLLEDAIKHKVQRVIYIAVAKADGYRHTRYFRAHEAVVEAMMEAVGRTGIQAGILRPTGFYSAFTAYLDLARQGVIPVFGDGRHRTNPIDERDLARIACDAILAPDAPGEIACGGPEVLTRKQIGELAFAAVGRSPRFLFLPAPLMRYSPLPFLVRLGDQRLGELLEFYTAVNLGEALAEPAGERRLGEYFLEQVAN